MTGLTGCLNIGDVDDTKDKGFVIETGEVLEYTTTSAKIGCEIKDLKDVELYKTHFPYIVISNIDDVKIPETGEEDPSSSASGSTASNPVSDFFNNLGTDVQFSEYLQAVAVKPNPEGGYAAEVMNLKPNTKYYFCALMCSYSEKTDFMNSQKFDFVYGSVKEFTTPGASDNPTDTLDPSKPGTYEPITYAMPEAVDLGLSVKWASFNLGATKPEEGGVCFMWGDTVGYGFDTSDGICFGYLLPNLETSTYYKWLGATDWITVSFYFTKYVPQECAEKYGFEGFYDDKTVLDPEDDAATAHLGSDWHTPTVDEWQELMNPDNCEWTADVNANDHVIGFYIRSKKPGYTDKSIYWPRVKMRVQDRVEPTSANPEFYGRYWSSTLVENKPTEAYALFYDYSMSIKDETQVKWCYDERDFGCAIRPVCK